MDIKDFEPLFGSWYEEGLIGSGSFGKVYKIKREEYGTTYYSALKWISIPQEESELKQLRYDGMDDDSISGYYKALIGSLTTEIQIMSQLRGHSNIISYEDHQIIPKKGSFGYDVFIRMELLTSLSEYYCNRPCSREDLIRLGIDLCNALEFCQKYNIIHRDIKPANIFVTENGDFKLGDFGIARQLEHTVTALSKKGTYSYMAPEVYKGERYNSSIDIYSLGIVMYKQSNGGRLPFLPLAPHQVTPDDNEKSLVRRMSGQLMPLPQHAEGRLGEIILKACAYDPKNRYSRPKQMRDELQAIQYSQKEMKFACKGDDDLDTMESSNRGMPQPPQFPEETEMAGFGEHPEMQGKQMGKRAANGELKEPQEPTHSAFDNQGTSRSPMDKTESGMGHYFENVDTGAGNGPSKPPKEKSRGKIYSVLGGLLALTAVIFFICRVATGKAESTKAETVVSKATATPEQMQQADNAQSTADNSAQFSDDSELATDALAHNTLTAGDVNKGIIAAGSNFTLVLNSDHTVTKIGGDSTISTKGWTGIMQISAYDDHAVGLCANGRLVYTGNNADGACDVGNWSDIKQVVTGYHFTAALTNSGEVLYTGFHKNGQDDCEEWTGIVKLFEGEDHIVGLKSNGTLVSAGYNGYNQQDISGLSNIVDGEAMSQTTFAVDSEGNAYAIGKDWAGENNVNSWINIVAIVGGDEHTVGLHSDGTVVAVGSDKFGQCDVEPWTDIVSIGAGQFHTIGVKSDGTLVATGKNSSGQCNVSGYKLW